MSEINENKDCLVPEATVNRDCDQESEDEAKVSKSQTDQDDSHGLKDAIHGYCEQVTTYYRNEALRLWTVFLNSPHDVNASSCEVLFTGKCREDLLLKEFNNLIHDLYAHCQARKITIGQKTTVIDF